MEFGRVTVLVSNLDESVGFYQDVLGMSVKTDLRKVNGSPLVFLVSGEGEFMLELIENAAEAYKGSGLSLGFHVDDVKAARERMAASGQNPTDITVVSPEVSYFYINDPDGVAIMLI